MIFLFNVGGYYLVFWGLRSQAKKELLHRLDADRYSSEDLLVLTIPMSLPYPIHQNGYERVNGEFEYQGEYYNLVKQRLENDTLFMVCIKNHHEKKLVNALSEYTSFANSLPSNAKNTIDLFGKLFKDYNSLASLCIDCGEGWSILLSFAEMNFIPISKDYPVVYPPPEVS